MTRIDDRYIENNRGSQRLAERARAVCPGGVSQVSRDVRPFPPYYERAAPFWQSYLGLKRYWDKQLAA